MSDRDQTRGDAAATAAFVSLATAGALFTILVWGGSPTVTKLGVRSIDSFTLAISRTVGAVPFALLIIALMRLRLPWHGSDKFALLGVAITGLIGFPVLFTLGVAHTTAGHAVVAQTATPIFAGLMEAAVNRRWPAVRWWIGISVSFAGVLVLIAETVGLGSTGATWQGDLLVIGGAFSAALSFFFGARLTPRFGAPAVTLWSVVAGGIILLPVLASRLEPAEIAAVDPIGWVALLYLSAGSTIAAYLTWFYALSRGGIGRMSVWHFTLPVVGVSLAAAVLGEPLTAPLVASTVIILVGVGLVQRR